MLGPHAHTASVPTLWAISPAHMFLLACFLVQMKPGGAPSVHRGTLLQSLYASGLSARLPFPFGVSVSLLRCIYPCLLEPEFPIPSSKLRAGGGLDWHRATGGFFHGFQCLSYWISSQLCHILINLQQLGSILLNRRVPHPSPHTSLGMPQ